MPLPVGAYHKNHCAVMILKTSTNMATGVSTCYISNGCNRTPHCADWGRNGFICYGSCNSVCLCVPETKTDDSRHGSIIQTGIGHNGRVNCVRWIRNQDLGPESEMVTGSVDKTAIVWEIEAGQITKKQTLEGHHGPVTAITGLHLGSGEGSRTVLVTASADSTVKIWSRSSGGEFVDVQTMRYGSGFVLDVSLVAMPGSNGMMLACACDDQKVHIYIETQVSEETQFSSVMTLPGHEDWVRAVDFTVDDSGDILLASASQDYLIRVWRFSSRPPDSQQTAKSISDLPLDRDIQMRENTFNFTYNGILATYAVSLETVLSGHENWIYSVKWKPPSVTAGDKRHQEMCLLSVSMDKTMILWSPDDESGVWTEQMRVGEVGGNTLGLYGGIFGPDGTSIFSHGYQGAFHQWAFNKESEAWDPVVTVSGHFDSVEDLDWDRGGGNFLLSCSLDETVRLHGPWVRGTPHQVSWFEIARPQVHGYALKCITMVTKYSYASGADEKVIRVFEAPDNFLENFCNLCGLDLETEQKNESRKSRPQGASVPALGLSNKAIFLHGPTDLNADLEIKPEESDQYADNVFTNVDLKEPPTEEHLLQNSLWPEIEKLYGHGYEVFTLATDPRGTVLASSCKASKAEFASVILWDTVTWQQLGSLEGHSLTVTQITFSHTGEYLLTVSRDRTWYLYRRKGKDSPESDPLYSRVSFVDKKTCVHTRIIWSCCWSHDDRYFLTASRDKKVLVWNCPAISEGSVSVVDKLDMPDSVTSVDSAPVKLANCRYLVSMGLDNGKIYLYSWAPGSPWQQLAALDNIQAHHLTVKRLKFRPCTGLAGIHGNPRSGSDDKDRDDWLQLASCGADHTVKVFNIYLPKLGTST